MSTLHLVGAGAQGRVCLAWLRAGEARSVAFVDDHVAAGTSVDDVSITGTLDDTLAVATDADRWHIAVGSPPVRLALAARCAKAGATFAGVQHPSAAVAADADLQPGGAIGAMTVINTGASVGAHTLVNNGAIVEHDAVLDAGASVGPGAIVGGRCRVGRGAFLGMGAVLLPRVRVGDFTVVAAGAVVTRDLPDGVLAMGVPAKVVGVAGAEFDWGRVL